MPRERDRGKERFWQGVMEQWRRSGQSVHVFCARHGLAVPSFYSWRRTLGEREQERRQPRPAGVHTPRPKHHDGNSADGRPVFVPVRVLAAAAALEVVLSRGRVLRVPAGFDAATLRQLLAILEETPC